MNIGYNEVTNSKEFEALSNEHKDSLKDSRKKYQKALYAIFQAVDESIFEKILESETAKEAWVTLQKLYKSDECVKRMKLKTIRSYFESLHMNDSESISDYFDLVQTIVN